MPARTSQLWQWNDCALRILYYDFESNVSYCGREMATMSHFSDFFVTNFGEWGEGANLMGKLNPGSTSVWLLCELLVLQA